MSSKKTSEGSTSSAKSATQATTFAAEVISVLSEVNLKVNINSSSSRLITMLSAFVQFAQSGLGIMFVNIPNYLNSPIFGRISQFFFLGYSEMYYDPNLFWIPFAIVMLSIIPLILIIVRYHFFRELPKWCLKFIRIWHCDFFGMFLFPTFQYAGCSFYHYGINPTGILAWWSFFLTFASIYIVFHIFRITCVLKQNPYFGNTILIWRVVPFYECQCILVSVIFLTAFCSYLENWMEYIPQIILFLITPIMYKIFSVRPFRSISMNSLVVSIPIFSITSSIFVSLRQFIHPYIVLFVPLAACIISHKLYLRFFLKPSYNKIKDLLSPESTKDYVFDVTQKDAIYYLQIGLEEKCPTFLDWSLSKKIAEKFKDDVEIMIYVTWFSSLFPSEMTMFHIFLKRLLMLSKKTTTMRQRCFVYQLHRIFMLRNNQASTEAHDDYMKIGEQSSKCIGYASSFWKQAGKDHNSVNDEIFYVLAQEILKTDSAWKEILDKYPNNIQIRQEYAFYLINGKCMFKEGVLLHQNSLELKSTNDQLFMGFLLQFPDYLKKGYVDVKGKLIGFQKGSKFLFSFSSDENSTQNSQKNGTFETDDEDSFIDEDEASSFLPNYKLRVAMENAIKTVKTEMVEHANIFAIVRMMMTLILSVFLCIYSATILSKSQIVFSNLTYFNELSHYIELISTEINWAYMESQQNYFANIEFPKQIMNNVYNLSRKALNMCDLFTRQLYQTSDNDISYQFGILYSSSNIVSAHCSREDLTIYNRTLTTRDYLFRLYLTTMIQLPSSTVDDVQNWWTSVDYCDIIAMNNNIMSAMNSFIAVISPKSSSFLNFKENTLSISTDNDLGINHQQNKKKFRNIISDNEIKEKNTIVKKANDLFKIAEEVVKERKEILSLFNSKNVNDDNKNNNKYNEKYNKEYSEENKGLKNTKENHKKNVLNKLEHFIHKIFLGEADLETNWETEKISTPTTNDGIRNNKVLDINLLEETDFLSFLFAFSPFAVFLFSLPSLIFLSTKIFNKRAEMFKNLLTAPEKEMFSSSQSFVSSTSRKDRSNMPLSNKSMNKNLSWSLIFITTMIVCICLIIIIFEGSESQTKCSYYCHHLSLMILQRNTILDIIREAVLMIIVKHLESSGFYINGSMIYATDVTWPDYQQEVMINYTDYFESLQKLIESGSEEFPPIVEFNPKISAFYTEPKCSNGLFVECASLNRLTAYTINCAKQVMYSNIFDIDSELFLGFYNLTHLRFAEDYAKLSMLYESEFNQMKTYNTNISIIVFIIILVCIFFAFFVELTILFIFKREFEAFKILLLRLNPLHFVANHELVSLIYGTQNKENRVVSSSHGMFNTAHDAMISLNSNMIIIKANPAVTNIFGFTSEQVLGQDLKFLLCEESVSKINYIIELMKSGETALIYECDANGTKDDGSNVSVLISLIGFTSGNGKAATSFAILMKDMTEEKSQMAAVAEAKKQAEVILLQILPKDIIVRLNRGDKDITFVVPSATIIFLDIEKFSTYSSTLCARDIMLNLSKIFTVFDKICSSFNLITKIKMIGDDYMAAGGLFTPDVDPQLHALQVVQFGLQCINALEELNVQLNSNLMVRVGVNTDGPVIAGVLGTEKPMFDIIGDPINVAARLQSTDIAGLVQISEGTYIYVNILSNRIEERGMIELKGKGKRKTFLVYPDEYDKEDMSHFIIQANTDSGAILKGIVDSNSLVFNSPRKKNNEE